MALPFRDVAFSFVSSEVWVPMMVAIFYSLSESVTESRAERDRPDPFFLLVDYSQLPFGCKSFACRSFMFRWDLDLKIRIPRSEQVLALENDRLAQYLLICDREDGHQIGSTIKRISPATFTLLPLGAT